MNNGSELQPLADVEDLLLDRLTVFHKRVEGIASVSKTPQGTPIDLPDLPHMTHLMGAMPANAPAVGRRVEFQRLVVARLLIAPLGKSEDIPGLGALANVVALPFYARLRNAYLYSPRLGITGEAEDFAYMTLDILFRDSGLVQRPGPGGGLYSAIDWTLLFNLYVPLPEGSDVEFGEENGEWFSPFGLS